MRGDAGIMCHIEVMKQSSNSHDAEASKRAHQEASAASPHGASLHSGFSKFELCTKSEFLHKKSVDAFE